MNGHRPGRPSFETRFALLRTAMYPDLTVGTFHNVSKKYLHLYVAELQFRYNNRFNNDIFGPAIEGA